ncbi:hypothetical protein M9H77_07793 [Catharanthus roseus]|uniref:Uncharacterized protein n=1 Tax=Catharanthus roseus TaxID=4058 RepID=A0ACC0BWD6_CATRO|nr:hypothetical protein M9H77_07793 [Catharanthus roseus]
MEVLKFSVIGEKKLVGGSKAGTTHLTNHLKFCVARKLRCRGQQHIQHSKSIVIEHANIAYTCLTAHYVDDNWELKKKILAYVHIPYPHDGILGVLDPRFKMNLVEFYYAIYSSDAYFWYMEYHTPLEPFATKMRNGIMSFQQADGESLYEA